MMGISYNNVVYLFRKNIFGDITHIYDTEGNLKARYVYDAWGNHKVFNGNGADITDSEDTTEIGLINPIRYRGYYYDAETDLYYLRARYYDPETGRFISQDGISYLDPEHLMGLNLYCYCANNPIIYADPSGNSVILLSTLISGIVIGASVGAAIGLGATVIKDFENGKLFDGDVTLQSYLGNFLGGVIAGAGIGLCSTLGVGLGAALATKTSLIVGAKMIGGVAVGGIKMSGLAALGIGVGGAYVTGGLGYVVKTGISNQETFEWADMFIEAGINAASGLLSFAGGIFGGYFGFKGPGNFNLNNFLADHVLQYALGIYPLKFRLSSLNKRLKEKY